MAPRWHMEDYTRENGPRQTPSPLEGAPRLVCQRLEL